ncbi:lipocalin-like domain-containing protein [Prevotella sp. DNF00663]|nr:lipocalin-like domain-containing protein [Prevotella sp. DNF00663]
MKKCLSIYALTGLLVGMLTSCEVEISGNGNLDGFWHLE